MSIDPSAPTPDRAARPDRWQPARAGILNVYQYGDETIHFAGGRLLLRGVNGSGKSTAMNMLLPFLLEADTRRIDAAGEQSGVLRSWMLSDNDETQRTGYLWIEFARPDPDAPGGLRHHAVGCGIRANRSTDRVTTWWFSTPRRPGIDVSLTVNQVPLAVDALRAELGADAVFTTTAEYRAEVARRFFGGADPSGYLALLHQIRNPRVGDRIATDLPDQLRAAMPPVPEDAVADAAQPLEDLEDHRRNVVALERTDRALRGLLGTYRDYARRVLHAAADTTSGAVTDARSAVQRRGKLRTTAEEADEAQRRGAAEVVRLDAEHRTAEHTLAGLLNSDAYREVRALHARRDQVRTLESTAEVQTRAVTRAERRVADAAGRSGALAGRAGTDIEGLHDGVVELDRLASVAAARFRLPAPPVLTRRALADGVDEPAVDPLDGFDLGPAGDAVRQRREQVREVRALLDTAQRRSADAEAADTRATDAQRAADRDRERAGQARIAVEQAADAHRAAVATWWAELAETAVATPPTVNDGPTGWPAVPAPTDPGGAEPRELARVRIEGARDGAAAVVGELDAALAAAALRVERAETEVDRLRADRDEVLAAAELPLPRAGWRSPEPADPLLFASLVDFADDVGDAERAGLEAACEASGLLTAVVSDDGSARAAAGELLVGGGAPVVPNLASRLVVAVPNGVGVDPAAVAAVLERVGLGAGSAAGLWVADDGRFAAGPLHGRHRKDTAELVGAGARAAARARRLVELAKLLEAADAALGVESRVRDELDGHRRLVRQLASRVPGSSDVDDAAAVAAAAAATARDSAEAATRAREDATAASGVAERAWAQAQTGAADAALSLDVPALDDVTAALADAATLLGGLDRELRTARRTLADWADAVSGWRTEVDVLEEAAERAAEATGAADAARTELTAIESALGNEPERIVAQAEELTARRDGLVRDLDAARATQQEAVGEASAARERAAGAEAAAATAEAACREARAALLAVLDVPGLLDAGRTPVDDGTTARPTDDGIGTGRTEGLAEPVPQAGRRVPGPAPESVEGTAGLVAELRDLVPEADREVSEDALDRSLRAIRDSLGSGWDAEARRGVDGAPVAVEVSGPYGRRALVDAGVQVAADLRRARGLLTAQQDQALRNLLHGRIAREVARALFDARELMDRMNAVLGGITTGLGVGVRLDWRTRGDLDPQTATALRLLGKDPDARSPEEDAAVRDAVSGLVDDARSADPESTYRDVIAEVLDYRTWHELKIYLRRPGRDDERLSRRTRLSEGEKKLVTYLPMAAAASASATAHDVGGIGAPRLLLLDDAFAKVSEDNHDALFGLLVELDLDFVVTSERLVGTHPSVTELAITEVLRDPDLRAIALLHARWDGRRKVEVG